MRKTFSSANRIQQGLWSGSFSAPWAGKCTKHQSTVWILYPGFKKYILKPTTTHPMEVKTNSLNYYILVNDQLHIEDSK
jgi:hypothetical protein